VRTDRTVVCWGDNEYGQASPPPEELFTMVSSGFNHTCGVNIHGNVICWGKNDLGQSDPPAKKFYEVSAGSSFTCGVELDGRVTCWGYDGNGQATPPADLSRLVKINGLPWLMLLLD
jgi:alpha-tubulin suppressor-like RCC1 family protein